MLPLSLRRSFELMLLAFLENSTANGYRIIRVEIEVVHRHRPKIFEATLGKIQWSEFELKEKDDPV